MNLNPTTPAPRGEVFYDAGCGMCTRGATRWGGLFARRGFHWLPLQTPGTPARTGASADELRAEMKLRFADGRVVGGAAVWAVLFRAVWWLWPLGVLMTLPGLNTLSAAAYRWIARNRYRISGACELPQRRLSISAWLPLLALPGLALLVPDELPAWVFMWLLAFAIYAGCKWLVYREAVHSGTRASWLRAAGFLFAWVGMDAKNFLAAPTALTAPTRRDWLWAVAKTCFGGALVWGLTPRLAPANDLLTGWLGMVGVIFLLHFGGFHLLALAWRAAGINATPLMHNPARAVSLGEFWGRRWNSAFHELVHRFTFRPVARRSGAIAATAIVFLLSGAVHDLVISVPARGGYGLPTAYFLLQGLGVIAEHTRAGRRLGLGGGIRGWAFTMAVTIAPAFWLFHPDFIRNVILPMLQTIGAT